MLWRSPGFVRGTDTGLLEDVTSQPTFGKGVLRVFDRWELPKVTNEDDAPVGGCRSNPQRRNGRHRCLVEDDCVETPVLDAVAEIGAGQCGGHHPRAGYDRRLNGGLLVGDRLGAPVNLPQPLVESANLGLEARRVQLPELGLGTLGTV